jgi:dynein light chain 1
MSYNLIEKLDGLQPCIKLHTLFIGNNKIKTWDEVGKLSGLPEIANVLLVGNIAIYGDKEKAEILPLVVKRIPHIRNVDGELIDDSIRKEAEALD